MDNNMEAMRIRRLIGEKLGLMEQDIAEDLRLPALPWDSLDFMELAVGLEQEFEIILPDERLIRCRTISEVAELIAAILQE